MTLTQRIADAVEVLDHLTDSEPLTNSEADDITSVLDKAAKEIKRLQAIVDKLPKTADGVPITPGMNLYTTEAGRGFVCCAIDDNDEGTVRCRDVRGFEFDLLAEQCYATPEAAMKRK